MIVKTEMETLELEYQETGFFPEKGVVPGEESGMPPDLYDADIDAFLRRMYALQQC